LEDSISITDVLSEGLRTKATIGAVVCQGSMVDQHQKRRGKKRKEPIKNAKTTIKGGGLSTEERRSNNVKTQLMN